MPKTTKGGRAKKSELPSTLQKSPEKAQETFAKVQDAAADEQGRVGVGDHEGQPQDLGQESVNVAGPGRRS